MPYYFRTLAAKWPTLNWASRSLLNCWISSFASSFACLSFLAFTKSEEYLDHFKFYLFSPLRAASTSFWASFSASRSFWIPSDCDAIYIYLNKWKRKLKSKSLSERSWDLIPYPLEQKEQNEVKSFIFNLLFFRHMFLSSSCTFSSTSIQLTTFLWFNNLFLACWILFAFISMNPAYVAQFFPAPDGSWIPQNVDIRIKY